MISSLFLTALISVESGGDPRAVSPDKRDVGVLQISPAVIKDVNRKFKTSYTLKDRYSVEMSKSICSLYLKMHCVHANLHKSGPATEEEMARIWNGGPKGMQKKCTEKYWLEKVYPTLQRLKQDELERATKRPR